MEPFEDSIPEERVETQQRLIALLQQAYRQEPMVSPKEQQEAIMRVEKRLAEMDRYQTPLVEESPKVIAGSFAFQSQSRSMRKKPMMHVMSVFAAMLVVGLLIGSAVLLLQRASLAGTSSLTTQKETPSVASITWDGLEMSMSVTPGPYFLGELVAVDLSLTNRTHPTLILSGAIVPNVCNFSALLARQTGGTSPHYIPYGTPVLTIYSCPILRINSGPMLFAGKTVTAHTYVLLTSSDDVTLTGEASFYLSGEKPQRGPGPLAGHLPTLLIHVTPQVPANRMLSLQQENNAVVVHALLGLHLLDQVYLICQDSAHHPWASGIGHTNWEMLSTNVLRRPDCAGTGLIVSQWNYAIGAVGYEVIQGQQGKYAGQHFP